ncbi:fasciclin domain-containing protein [Puia sp.]|jgi:hypothetical protein|uniref:fasciclin domain-containing protein n=1 Tax=Puia sp. TaxID=2045100 RepID=UPI002F40CDF5
MRKSSSLAIHLLPGLLSLLLIGFLACKKTPPPKVQITPLQTLINTDTNLNLFHRMILQANDVVLLNDEPVILFIPHNSVLIQAGYPEVVIDSMSSTLADRIVRYQYLTSPVNTDSAGYTPNPTLLGVPLYIGRDGAGNLLLNGIATAPDKSVQVGKASVYYLNTLVPASADSLTELLQTDSSLSLFAQVFARTNLYDSLLLSGGFTVLAPVNSAMLQAGFDSLRIDTVSIDTLLSLAQDQVVKGAWFSTTFPSALTTLNGSNIAVSVVNGVPQFAGNGNPLPVHWLSGDQVSGAGLILHHTDGVLSP